MSLTNVSLKLRVFAVSKGGSILWRPGAFLHGDLNVWVVPKAEDKEMDVICIKPGCSVNTGRFHFKVSFIWLTAMKPR